MENHYELLYIVSIKYIEDELQRVRDAVSKVITENEGTITLDEVMGKQRLAYPIKNVHQGTYVVIEMDAPGTILKEIDKNFKLMPEILRYLVVKKKILSKQEQTNEERMKELMVEETKSREIVRAAKQDARSGRRSSRRSSSKKTTIEKSKPVEEPAKDEDKKVVAKKDDALKSEDAKKEDTTVKVKADVVVREKPEKVKATLEDLDKKLDEILTEEIL